jgi:hypothetical protein
MKELNSIQVELKANKSQTNKFGGYKYRSLEDINEAVKPLLAEHSCCLVLSDTIELVGDRHYVKATATITNAEGVAVSVTAFAREPFSKKGMDDAQITGSTSSYARKYALNGLFAIDDTKDADSMDNTKHVTAKKLFKTKLERNTYIAGIVVGLQENQPSVVQELWRELSKEQQQDLWSEFGSTQQTAIRESLV